MFRLNMPGIFIPVETILSDFSRRPPERPFGVNAVNGLVKKASVDIRPGDTDIPILQTMGKIPVYEDRDGIGFLSGGTSGAPYP